MKTDKGETLFRVPFVLLRALIVLRPEKVKLRGEEEEAEGFGASGILLVLLVLLEEDEERLAAPLSRKKE